MEVGVPRETKDGERRVGLTPDAVRTLVADGHGVYVEHDAGEAVGFPDHDYRAAGARITDDVSRIWGCALIVKVKELQPPEVPLLRAATTVLGFAQLNRDRAMLEAVIAAGVRVIACEAIRDSNAALPCLAPMSRIAGRLAPLVGAMALTGAQGGAGVLLPGVDDVPPARVVVVGAGNVGGEAARVAADLGCPVQVFSRGEPRLRQLAETLAHRGTPVDARHVEGIGDPAFDRAVRGADLVIGAVLEPGVLSPKLIPRALVRAMRPGSVIVDVGIDHGGIAETSRMTKLSDPTYVEEAVVHYAVANMPALVPRTATLSLVRATLPYVRALAGGIEQALGRDDGLRAAVMTWDGAVVHGGLANDTGKPCVALAAGERFIAQMSTSSANFG